MAINFHSNRIIITGASGMVGYYVLREGIRLGYQNMVLLLREQSKTRMLEQLEHKNQFEIKTINFEEYDQLYDVIEEGDMVIHCAAQINESIGDLSTSNVKLTETLINASLDKKAAKFIYLSSVAALNRWTKHATREDDIMTNREKVTDYAFSKYEAEMEVWRGEAEGLNTIVLNPSQILGLGYWDNPNSRLWKRISEIKKYYPQGSLGMVDVRDVAQAVWKSVDKPLDSCRIIINGEHRSYQEFFNQFRDLLNIAPLPKALPDFLHLHGAFFFKIYYGLKLRWHNPYNKKYLRQLMHTFKYDNQRSKDLLGIEYRSFDQTLTDIAEVFDRKGDSEFGVLG